MVMLPMRPVDKPTARSSENKAISFLKIAPTQPMKKDPTCHDKGANVLSLSNYLTHPKSHRIQSSPFTMFAGRSRKKTA